MIAAVPVYALAAATIAGVGYLTLALWQTVRFARRTRKFAAQGPAQTSARVSPPVTILKPLRGDEPRLFENLSSFCDQQYPSFQIIFGVRDEGDPAAGVVRRVIHAYPDLDIALVCGGDRDAPNRKVANLLNMMPLAKHDIIVVADSDIQVGRRYLLAIADSLGKRDLGALTCLYRAQTQAVHSGGIVEALAAMFIEEQFAPSVLVATSLSPMDFCLGATMALTRATLEAIGGFEAISSYLADDQMLGRLVRRSGSHVELSPYVVETAIEERTFAELWEHEVRWARTMHAARPWGYSFSFLSYGLPLSVFTALAAGAPPWSIALVGVAGVLRFCLHYSARSALSATSRAPAWLVPVRDLLGLAVWAAHFFGSDVRWRAQRLRVGSDGRLQPGKERARASG